MRGAELPVESATKERRRRRLVAAAVEILDAGDGTGFSVDEVAARAEMSRRSVFNYFPTVDDLVVAAGTEMLWAFIETIRVETVRPDTHPDPDHDPDPDTGDPGDPGDPGTEPRSDEPAAIFDELASALRSTDIVHAMVRLTNALSGVAIHPRVDQTVRRALIRVTETLATELLRRHPSATDLEIDLLVSTVVAGVVTLSEHWSVRTGLVDDAESRALWDHLLDLLLKTIRDGYLATAPAIRTH